MQVFSFCEYFGFLFVSYCLVNTKQNVREKIKNSDRFEVEYQWSYVNYTWKSREDYRNSVINKRYIPENNVISGVKFYKDKFYVALPRLRKGSPVTLAHVSRNARSITNPLLRPFPSWKMNARNDCATFQNVHSIEIDKKGIMWVLDGNRFNDYTSCPPKIVLLDLNKKGKVIQTYVVPNEVSMRDGGFLKDLVLDESDGGYAFITENSEQDPGIIVYSRFQNRAWKIRDRTMYSELENSNFSVDGVKNEKLISIDGIAMDPVDKTKPDGERLVYYSALSGNYVYAISNIILKNEQLCRSALWRRYIQKIGPKQGPTDGMIMDRQGNMYYGLLNLYGIAKWNNQKPFNTSIVMDTNQNTLVWPQSFTFDNSGFMYVLANGIHKFYDPHFPLHLSNDVKFRLLRIFTGTKSYLY